MREQVIAPRAGRGAAQGKARGAGVRGQAVKRPASKRPQASSAGATKGRARGNHWRTFLRVAPLVAKGVLAVFAGVLVFAGYRAAASAPFFKLKTVEVVGVQRASRDDVKDAVERAVSGVGVWRADLDALSGELGGLPWVRAAYVQRVLPSGLRVRVVERAPLLVARNATGRLFWVDDEGVQLGAASVSEQDFIVRGLEEERSPQARAHNRERVAVAVEMKREWGRDGLSERVSEVNLGDLRDVRVQLAGDDSRIDVRLGREDYVKRLRVALEELDARRTTFTAPVTYIDLTTGRNAIFGFPHDARPTTLRAQGEKTAEEKSKEGTHDETQPAPKKPARERDKPRDERKRNDKREAAKDKPAPATRERRVG